MSTLSIPLEYIEIASDMCFGKPHIAGSRITVANVATMYLQMGQSLEEIAGKYALSLASVHAAMAYYYENREEIDRRQAENEVFAEAFREKNVSPLEEKLRGLGG
ncbi:MAG: DUF433 domain-containing protein [Cyanobacteria bacterium SBLK]|nr:DUF433 domain-containing protein [Cyanobacteria bacterium SBLK]